MKKQNESVQRFDIPDLEFPDWSGMDPTPRKMTPEQAFELLDHYQEWFREPLQLAQRMRPPKCTVEFIL